MDEAQFQHIVITGREEQVQNTGEQNDEQNRLQALHQSLQSHLGNLDADSQTQGQNAVGHDALGAKQRHDVQRHQQNLGSGIQLVCQRSSGEILTQRNIFQHTAPPFRRA